MLRNQNIISFQFDSHQSFVHLYFHYFIEFFSTPIPAHGQSQLMIGSTSYFYGGFCCCCSFQQHSSICKHFTATQIFCTKGEQLNPSMTFHKSVKRTAPSKQTKKHYFNYKTFHRPSPHSSGIRITQDITKAHRR